MARIDNFFDTGQGIVGNLVFYKMQGTGIVRTKPAHFSDRKSTAQLAQRQRLKAVNAFLKPFTHLIRITFAAEALDKTARVVAMSHIMKNALAGEYPEIYVDRSNALLSKGPLPLPARAWAENHSGELLIRWENGEEMKDGAASDHLLAIALSEDNSYADFRFTEVRRSAGAYLWKPAIKMPEIGLPGVWIAFRNWQETQLSDSMYLGE